MLTGTPLAIPNWKLHNIIETSGGAVVCEEMCTGTRYFERLVDETKETVDEQIQALAERYMGINCACFTPNTARIDDIIRLAKGDVISLVAEHLGLSATNAAQRIADDFGIEKENKSVIALVIQLGLNTDDLKLFSAAFVAVALFIPHWRCNHASKTLQKGGKGHA